MKTIKHKHRLPTRRGKIICSYTALFLCAIFVIGIIINTLINKSFEQYALDRQKKQIAVIIAQVEQQYNAETDATASKPTAAVSALKTVRGKARRLA